MNQKETRQGCEPINETCCIESLLKQVKEFDPGQTSASWAPNDGGEIIVALNKLHDCMIKKAAEIKQYVRTLTVEELNDLDGFDRCNVAQPAVDGTNATLVQPASANANSSAAP